MSIKIRLIACMKEDGTMGPVLVTVLRLLCLKYWLLRISGYTCILVNKT